MDGKPDIVVPHILVNVDKDKHAWSEHAEQKIGPLRDRVGREELRIHQQINDHYDPRKEERK